MAWLFLQLKVVGVKSAYRNGGANARHQLLLLQQVAVCFSGTCSADARHQSLLLQLKVVGVKSACCNGGADARHQLQIIMKVVDGV